MKIGLGLALLTLLILALEQPLLAGMRLRSCDEMLRAPVGSAQQRELISKCTAMMSSSGIRAGQMVGDEWRVQRELFAPRFNRRCADADDAATCLAKLDAIAGWTASEARREAEWLVPHFRQCFIYRTEALREARGANDYERIGLFESKGHLMCCEEQERAYRDGLPLPKCPEPAPTPPSASKTIGWDAEWGKEVKYGVALLLTLGWVVFGIITIRAVIRRTPYGLWWRRATPTLLIVLGVGLGVYEYFKVFGNPLRPFRLAIAGMMIVGGALFLWRSRGGKARAAERADKHDSG